MTPARLLILGISAPSIYCDNRSQNWAPALTNIKARISSPIPQILAVPEAHSAPENY